MDDFEYHNRQEVVIVNSRTRQRNKIVQSMWKKNTAKAFKQPCQQDPEEMDTYEILTKIKAEYLSKVTLKIET